MSRALLQIPALLYEGVVSMRNALYDRGILPSRKLARPVISIGNLTWGGTGKTPLVIYLGQLLLDAGASPAVLTRGYGRAGRKPIMIAPPEPIADPGSVLGDEPALVRRHLPQCWFGISPDRYGAGRALLESGCRPVFILDDGFQHRRLRRDLDLLVVDGTQPLSGNCLLPRGTLREPLASIRRCHAVILNGSAEEAGPHAEIVRGLHPGARVFRCAQTIQALAPFEDWEQRGTGNDATAEIPPALLVAAIGNPARFRADIDALGITIRGERFFRDHHSPSPQEWSQIAAQARANGAQVIITTEKDAVKIKHRSPLPLLVACQATRMERSEEFRRFVLEAIGDRL